MEGVRNYFDEVSPKEVVATMTLKELHIFENEAQGQEGMDNDMEPSNDAISLVP